MGRFGNRVLAAGVAGGFAVALAVGGGVPAGAAPASGTVASMSDLKGAWVTSLTGFQAGDPVSWQHRLTVRKVKGAAAVAFEEWRDCAEHASACKAGKATGGGWTSPSRVLLVMDPKGVVHGVGASGTLELTPGEGAMSGMTAVMIGAGQQQDTAPTPAPPATGSVNARSTPGVTPAWPVGETSYAVFGPMAPSGYTDLPGAAANGLS